MKLKDEINLKTEDTIEERLHRIEERIAAACDRAGRDPSEVNLLPVSKTHPPDIVSEAAQLGLTVFGENRIQEARKKIPMCPGHLKWHLIGHLQTNKAKYVPRLFEMVHSVDSMRVLDALEKSCSDSGRIMQVMIEVNMAGEGSKFGISPEALPDLLLKANEMPHIEPVGLMTMPPFREDPEKVRPIFRETRLLRDSAADETGIPLEHLSMGMTHDFEVAIEEGSTWIRIGTGLFGKRGSPWKPRE